MKTTRAACGFATVYPSDTRYIGRRTRMFKLALIVILSALSVVYIAVRTARAIRRDQRAIEDWHDEFVD